MTPNTILTESEKNIILGQWTETPGAVLCKKMSLDWSSQ